MASKPATTPAQEAADGFVHQYQVVDLKAAMVKWDNGNHVADCEVEVLLAKFKGVVRACLGVPRYAVVFEDAVHREHQLQAMVDARTAQGTWAPWRPLAKS